MTGRVLAGLCLAALTLAGLPQAGCSGKSEDTASSSAASGAAATESPYDKGPRANTVAADAALAAKGKALFTVKGCTACHGFGQRMSGPDLKGVTARRSAEWLKQWLAHPDDMLKTDPIARQLLAQYPTQMPNLHLPPEEIDQLVEFLRMQDSSPGAAK